MDYPAFLQGYLQKSSEDYRTTEEPDLDRVNPSRPKQQDKVAEMRKRIEAMGRKVRRSRLKV